MTQDCFPPSEEAQHQPGSECPCRPQMEFRGCGELEGESRWVAIHRTLAPPSPHPVERP